MIQVSRLNGSVFYINPLHIEWFEATPDVVITLTNGKKLIVAGNVDELIAKIIEFYKQTGGLTAIIKQSQNQENES